MLTLPVLRRAIDHLRKPFTQRLILLVACTLLAMSLISMTTVLTLPPSRLEGPSLSSQPIEARHRGAICTQSFMPNIHAHEQQVTEKYHTERRFA